MARGAGPWWAGAGQAPCAVVGNWGPGWNVGGTLILSATVVLRHRSPLPPPICSFHRSYGKHSCTRKYTHANIHVRLHTYTHTHTSASAPLLICCFGFSFSTPAALPPNVLPSPSHEFSLQVCDPTSFRSSFVSEMTASLAVQNIKSLPRMLVRNLCYEVIQAPGN